MTNSKNSFFSIALLGIALICSSVQGFSQTEKSAKLAKFLILIETTDNGMKVTGKEGCAFTDLSFTYSTHNNQAIDQSGMTRLNKNKQPQDISKTDFLFVIDKTNDGISLEGIVGTAWKTLNFACPKGKCHQYIDQNGMTEPKEDKSQNK